MRKETYPSSSYATLIVHSFGVPQQVQLAMYNVLALERGFENLSFGSELK